MTGTDAPLRQLAHKLGTLASLDRDDEAEILALKHREGRVAARGLIVREGTIPSECCLLVEGFAARSKLTIDGKRQIVSFHIPGDILDLQHLFLARADHNVHAVTDSLLTWIPMSDLRSLVAARPAIGQAFWRDALIDASIFREWVLNVGRRDAKTRIAHMLCEFVVRSEAAGLGAPTGMRIPFTQDEIADATGLTPIHVNRMLKVLMDDGSLSRKERQLTIDNWSTLRSTANFDRAYLHAAA